MIKKLYIIFLLFASSCLFGVENNYTLPNTEFQSVNLQRKCVNYNPPITEVGANNIYEETTINKTEQPRRVGISEPDDPFPDPIGDVPVCLILGLVGLFCVYKKIKLENIYL